jgi:hypothetical protein
MEESNLDSSCNSCNCGKTFQTEQEKSKHVSNDHNGREPRLRKKREFLSTEQGDHSRQRVERRASRGIYNDGCYKLKDLNELMAAVQFDCSQQERKFQGLKKEARVAAEQAAMEARVAAEQAATEARVAAEQAAKLLAEKKQIEEEKKKKKEEENKRLAAAAAAVQTTGRRSTRVKRTDHRTRYQGSGEWE